MIAILSCEELEQIFWTGKCFSWIAFKCFFEHLQYLPKSLLKSFSTKGITFLKSSILQRYLRDLLCWEYIRHAFYISTPSRTWKIFQRYCIRKVLLRVFFLQRSCIMKPFKSLRRPCRGSLSGKDHVKVSKTENTVSRSSWRRSSSWGVLGLIGKRPSWGLPGDGDLQKIF